MSQRRERYRVSQAAVRLYHHLLFGYRSFGVENVPLDGACILAANHKSYLDPPAVGACLPREIRYFAKRELFDMPVLGPLIRSYGAVPVDRAAFDRKTLRMALGILESGEALLVFPEGTRIRKPDLGQAKEGIALIADKAAVPVIPVWVGHTYEPQRGLFRRIPVEIRFGKPIQFEKEEGEDRREHYASMVDTIMTAIARLGNLPATTEPRAEGTKDKVG